MNAPPRRTSVTELSNALYEAALDDLGARVKARAITRERVVAYLRSPVRPSPSQRRR